MGEHWETYKVHIQGALCFQQNGRSLVDYIITDEHVMNIIPTLWTSQPTHLSDHAHINCNIQIDKLINRHNQDKFINNKQVNENIKFKWDGQSETHFLSTIKLPIIRDKLQSITKTVFLSNQLGIDAHCQQLSQVINFAGKMCLKTIKSKKLNSAKKHKLGFDKECSAMKNHVLHLGKLVSKYPRDPHIYGHFISEKKKFKKLVGDKNKSVKDSMLNEIMNCEQKDPKTFWKLINNLKEKKKDIKTQITIDQWSSYFRKLHNNKNTSYDHTFADKILRKLKKCIQYEKYDPFMAKHSRQLKY